MNCWFCGLQFKRKKNFASHLLQSHGKSNIIDAYVDANLNGIYPTCLCGCGIKSKWISEKHGFSKYINGHNGKLSSLDKNIADEIKKKRKETFLSNGHKYGENFKPKTEEAKLKHRNNLSKGLREYYKTHSSWTKGLTKETDSRVAKFANEIKQRFATGVAIPWAKGKTKETCEKVRKMSESVKRVMNDEGRRRKLDALKRLSNEEIERRLIARAPDLRLISDLETYTRDKVKNLKFVCVKCNHEQTKSLIQALTNRCEICSPPTSRGHIELFEFCRTLDQDAKICDTSIITPYELDITFSKKKLAIEYNGLYFHSEIFKDKNYHSNKSKDAEKAGYRLIHVFEDEWLTKPDSIKSSITHALGMSQTKIYARKCEIREVSPKIKKQFFDDNHIDGDARSFVSWGLFYMNAIVACISLRKPLHKKWKQSYEICRYATKNGVHISGGLSRLLSVCIKKCKSENITSLMTYADSRHGTGNCYLTTGFKQISETPNRFWWTDGKVRLDRFKIKADSATGLTEAESAFQFGVVKIWGCKNYVFQMII